MLFQWLRQRRRQKLLAEPFPPAWRAVLEDQVVLYRYLDPSEQLCLLDLVRIFIAEKEFEGCKGLEVTDEHRVVIAALAVLLVLRMQPYCFDNVPTILVYPEAFRAPEQLAVGTEVAIQGESSRLGEAHYRGPVILSWADVEEDVAQPGFGQNLVVHEFTHQLDMLNGDADGVPSLPRPLRKRWQRVMAREYERLCKAADRGRETLIDPYGASEPAEFFAVVTETFYDDPLNLRIEHPELYAVLHEYFRVDPATWFGRMNC